MKKKLLKFSLVLFILSVSFFLLTDSGFALLEKPYASFAGDQFSLTSNVLSFYNDITIDSITYYGTPPASDPLLYGSIVFTETIYQSTSNLLYFDDGSGGGISFDVRDGSGTTYFSGVLDPFVVTSVANMAYFNLTYDLDNVSNWAFSGLSDSQFKNEGQVRTGNGSGPGELSLFLTFTSGSLTSGGSGQASGKLSVVPEPVSSLLFVMGGTVLGFMRYARRKK